jgi:hypothetical protein
MLRSEVAAALRALADKIAAPAPQQRPQAPASPAPTGSGVNGVVAFWDVKVRDNGKPMASLKLATGERFPCFDEKVIAAVDPLVKGQEVTVYTKPWVKKDGSTEFLLVGVDRKHNGIQENEIPF